ncbi:hypothetical protein MRX96_002051 [Rhipicephalus microplus]
MLCGVGHRWEWKPAFEVVRPPRCLVVLEAHRMFGWRTCTLSLVVKCGVDECAACLGSLTGSFTDATPPERPALVTHGVSSTPLTRMKPCATVACTLSSPRSSMAPSLKLSSDKIVTLAGRFVFVTAHAYRPALPVGISFPRQLHSLFGRRERSLASDDVTCGTSLGTALGNLPLRRPPRGGVECLLSFSRNFRIAAAVYLLSSLAAAAAAALRTRREVAERPGWLARPLTPFRCQSLTRAEGRAPIVLVLC